MIEQTGQDGAGCVVMAKLALCFDIVDDINTVRHGITVYDMGHGVRLNLALVFKIHTSYFQLNITFFFNQIIVILKILVC